MNWDSDVLVAGAVRASRASTVVFVGNSGQFWRCSQGYARGRATRFVGAAPSTPQSPRLREEPRSTVYRHCSWASFRQSFSVAFAFLSELLAHECSIILSVTYLLFSFTTSPSDKTEKEEEKERERREKLLSTWIHTSSSINRLVLTLSEGVASHKRWIRWRASIGVSNELSSWQQQSCTIDAFESFPCSSLNVKQDFETPNLSRITLHGRVSMYIIFFDTRIYVYKLYYVYKLVLSRLAASLPKYFEMSMD